MGGRLKGSVARFGGGRGKPPGRHCQEAVPNRPAMKAVRAGMPDVLEPEPRPDPPWAFFDHAAGRQPAMGHIAPQDVQAGKVVDRMEHAADEQYGAR